MQPLRHRNHTPISPTRLILSSISTSPCSRLLIASPWGRVIPHNYPTKIARDNSANHSMQNLSWVCSKCSIIATDWSALSMHATIPPKAFAGRQYQLFIPCHHDGALLQRYFCPKKGQKALMITAVRCQRPMFPEGLLLRSLEKWTQSVRCLSSGRSFWSNEPRLPFGAFWRAIPLINPCLWLPLSCRKSQFDWLLIHSWQTDDLDSANLFQSIMSTGDQVLFEENPLPGLDL